MAVGTPNGDSETMARREAADNATVPFNGTRIPRGASSGPRARDLAYAAWLWLAHEITWLHAHTETIDRAVSTGR